MTIRKGKVEDISQILQVVHESIRTCVMDHHRNESTIQTWLEKVNQQYLMVEMLYNDSWVYVLNQQIVGVLLISDRGEILLHCVNLSMQNTGIGTDLLNYAIHQMLNHKQQHIQVKSTLSAMDYYLSLGFETKPLASTSPEQPVFLFRHLN